MYAERRERDGEIRDPLPLVFFIIIVVVVVAVDVNRDVVG